jgi:hypothetical protein
LLFKKPKGKFVQILDPLKFHSQDYLVTKEAYVVVFSECLPPLPLSLLLLADGNPITTQQH